MLALQEKAVKILMKASWLMLFLNYYSEMHLEEISGFDERVNRPATELLLELLYL